jgi:hypothetical protein
LFCFSFVTLAQTAWDENATWQPQTRRTVTAWNVKATQVTINPADRKRSASAFGSTLKPTQTNPNSERQSNVQAIDEAQF